MAQYTNILKITLDGTGTEIPTLNISEGYFGYLLTGTALSTGNYAIVATGSPQLGNTFIFIYDGTLDITTNGNTFSLFGNSISQQQLLKRWIATLTYNGSAWDMQLSMDFTQSQIVETAHIVDLAVTTGKIANLAVTSGKLATDSVITSKILDLNVTTAKINDLAVTDAKLAADSVITSKILDSNVTNAKLANMNAYTLKGNNTGGAAAPKDISMSTLFNSNAWSLTGNSGTSAGTNFIGTTDSVPLVFKVNSVYHGALSYLPGETSLGYNALSYNSRTGDYNTAFGQEALRDNDTGYNNVAVGHNSLTENLYGYQNTAIGKAALMYSQGSSNSALGDRAGVSVINGSKNTIIGAEANVDLATSTNRIALGYQAVATENYQFALPDNVTKWKIRGNSFTLPSADGSANAVLQTDGSGVLSFGQVVTSGTYPPTLTNVTNVDSSTAYECQYTRIGSMVTVSGKVTIAPTATGATELGMSLPIASNFANEQECAGTASDGVTQTHPVRVKADAANNRVSFVFDASSNANADYSFIFMYQII